MKSDVLKLIRNAKEYVSIETLCQACEMSPLALKTTIAQLEASGYDIDRDSEKGYKLISYPENISSTELISRATTNWAGKVVFYRKETTSTNEEAKLLAEDGRGQGALVVAENQTEGKGRKGRSWYTDGRNSVAFSLILRPDFGMDKVRMIPMVMSIAIADVLTKLTDLDVKIKWPNDIIINGKKVAGILTELGTRNEKIDHVIVGVGINLNQKLMPEDIADKATSLFMEKGERYSRADVIVAVMEFFEYYYDIFVSSGDISDMVAVYESYLVNKDKEVKIHDPNGDYEGVATGINDFGELIVQRDDGKYIRISSGEVSVRGVYGYV